MYGYASTGQIRIYPLLCGGDMSDWSSFDPFDEKVGTKVFSPYFIYVITHPGGNVLFDSGPHPDLHDKPHARIGAVADTFLSRVGPDDWLVPKLATIGMKREDISRVVQSHLHFDHAGGLEWLRHAPIYTQRTELAFARNPPVYQRAIYVARDFEHRLDWVELDGVHDIFGDGVLTIIPTPGHSKGHQSLLVRLAGRTVFLLGDATYRVEKMRARALPAILWNPDVLVDTWQRIEAIEAREKALLLENHVLEFRESVPLAPVGWYA